jgi:hypothetical protein
MAQHDYTIANQGFPAFRSDLNNALAAIVSNNSGATEPSTMFAHQLWVDTAANPSILKMRNADNDAWITIGTIDQTGDKFVFSPAGGSASQVAYGVAGDTNTGIFFPAADTIAFAEGGAEAMRIDSSGNVGIGTSSITFKLEVNSGTTDGVARFESSDADAYIVLEDSNSSSAYNRIGVTTHDMWFYTNNNERMRITSAGEVLVGGTTEISSAAGLTVQNAAAPANTPAKVYLYRNDLSIASADILGEIGFYGNDTTSNTPTQLAYIEAAASGTHAAGDNPTDLVFGTTPVGSATVAEVARFTQDKYLRMASGTGGIQFNGDTAAGNALDDYEEGTWTPVISDANSGGNLSPTAATSAIYTKVGRMVTVQCFFTNVDTTGMTAGNNYTIQGFPFTAASVTGTVIIPGSIIVQNITFSGYLTPALFDNTTYARIAKNVTGTTASYVLVSDTSSGVTDFYLNMTYQSA